MRYATSETEFSLGEQLLLLEKLQQIDKEIDGHQSDLVRLPLEVQDIARNLVVIRRENAEDGRNSRPLKRICRKKSWISPWNRTK